MQANNAITLTQRLIQMNTLAENGEVVCAEYLGQLLEQAGFTINYHEYAPRRVNLVAHYRHHSDALPLVFTGHMDVVPLGCNPWLHDPFAGESDGDKLYGRGSTDMKGGIAAFIVAALNVIKHQPKCALTLVITAGEETGCEGALQLARQTQLLGNAGALLVGEPTDNMPLLGHRGVLWLDVLTHGVTAHGSMPDKGDNAIYKAAEAIQAMQQFKPLAPQCSALGDCTLNVSMMQAGLNINSVPDLAKFTVDFRTITDQGGDAIINQLKHHLGDAVDIKKLLDLQAVETQQDHPWVQQVLASCEQVLQKSIKPSYAPYFTDASVLQSAYDDVPTIILGPGSLSMAHKTDEFISRNKLEQAVVLYEEILKRYVSLEQTSSLELY
ncbi:MAG: M20 family metallopeptidase [Coxiellaceae bacterium]|nr:M20 family metallopeptidase [Coxiellaceae bacterium]